MAQPQKTVFLDSTLSVPRNCTANITHPIFCSESYVISQATSNSRHSIHGNSLNFHMFSFLVFASSRQAGTLADHMHLSAHDYPAISNNSWLATIPHISRKVLSGDYRIGRCVILAESRTNLLPWCSASELMTPLMTLLAPGSSNLEMGMSTIDRSQCSRGCFLLLAV
ncbi:uncharacterized protein EAE98_001910 [Botrytis deweyae]|uniref:Uncharacterized protein n=1 Tax=Botrytis deweyae TaxID=2478750 RepID=A0ABQ7IZ63_9HELO|nr:uncharacterized protein EAE98_001910 [Botrytis deweyae]KAF7937596.1 hypothetical protein EAE98_001910 [Botrytis deweyae]